MTRSNPLLLFSSTLLLAGCVFHVGSDTWDDPGYASAFESRDNAYELRLDNRRRMRDLQTGMSEADVDRVMGTGAVWINDAVGEIANPYKTEGWTDADGNPMTARYYYTTVRKRDNIIGDDELTPVVFKSGRVVGWGDSFFDRHDERPH